jgi:hypothetical protein
LLAAVAAVAGGAGAGEMCLPPSWVLYCSCFSAWLVPGAVLLTDNTVCQLRLLWLQLLLLLQ